MRMKKYVVAIDQSTSASKVFLLNQDGDIVRRYAKNHQQFYPHPGFVEHDASEIWQNVREGVAEMTDGLPTGSIAALAISNQRETTMLWDRETGEPLCRAVVWQDVRAEDFCNGLKTHADTVRAKTGLALSAYYPAAKAASVLLAQPELARRAAAGGLCAGTVDSYLIYRLTEGRTFATDVSNASRTQLMALSSLDWDDELLSIFGIHKGCLPKILLSDGHFGVTMATGLPLGIPITGVMGDSHAALFGQGCLSAGMVKATYGTGSSVMMNVGLSPIFSANGLSTSVGFGFNGQTCYVLEGNVTCSGDTLCWLRDEAGLVPGIAAVEPLAAGVADTGGVYLVPAFSGLGAPYFDSRAQALLCGMNRGTTKAHIVRAALERMAYQDVDVILAMRRDTGKKLHELRVDGGPTRNALLMQFQSDLLDCNVRCSVQSELSALGAGYLAGISAGVYESLDAIPAACRPGAVYAPQMSEAARKSALDGWHAAVGRCRQIIESN